MSKNPFNFLHTMTPSTKKSLAVTSAFFFVIIAVGSGSLFLKNRSVETPSEKEVAKITPKVEEVGEVAGAQDTFEEATSDAKLTPTRKVTQRPGSSAPSDPSRRVPIRRPGSFHPEADETSSPTSTPQPTSGPTSAPTNTPAPTSAPTTSPTSAETPTETPSPTVEITATP